MSVFDSNITLILDGVTFTLTKISDNGTTSVFRDTQGNRRLFLTVDQNLKSGASYGESHMVRLDVEDYTSEGVFLRKTSAWTVVKTTNAVQDDALAEAAVLLLGSFIAASTNVADIVNGAS